MDELVGEPELKSQDGRGPTVVCVLAGLTVGYLGWLAAVSVVVAVGAALWGRRLRREESRPLAAFAMTLPVLPVALTLGVLTYTYL